MEPTNDTGGRPDVRAALGWSRDQLEAHTNERLALIAEHAYANSAFHRRLWDEHGVSPGAIRSRADLGRLPVVTKRDIGASQDARPPFGEHLAVDPATLLRTHVNTGPSVSSLQFDVSTSADVAMSADIGELLFRIAGVTEHDRVVNTRQFGFSPAGLFMEAALEQIGANVAPMGLEDNRRLVRALADWRPTVIESFTTQCIRIARTARDMGLDPAEWGVERLLIGGEPGGGAAAVRAELGELYGDPLVLEYYGSAEVRLAAIECPQNEGLHLAEPFTAFELVDPETFEPVGEGEPGVLLATSLHRWATPMLRINTEDVTTLHRGPCPCGVPFARIGKLLGKRSGIVRAGGKNQYPEPIIGAVKNYAEVERFRVVVRRDGVAELDTILLELEAPSELPGERLAALREDLLAVLNVEPGITVECRQVRGGTIPAEARFQPLVDEREDAYAG